MNTQKILRLSLSATLGVAAALFVGACASTGDKPPTASSAPPAPNRYVATDGRTIDIGKSSAANGGASYSNPHMEKGKCWVATGFDFNGYDTIYLAPTLSTAKFPDKPEDTMVHNLAKQHLVSELAMKINERKIFANVVTNQADVKPGAKVLTLENTITEFNKGGGAARYFVGLYGGGQPVLRVQGKLSEVDKPVFTYEARRSGTSAGARLGGVFMKDEDIQIGDIQSMVLDLTDFMAAIARKYQPKS
jgi:hypothetical protein